MATTEELIAIKQEELNRVNANIARQGMYAPESRSDNERRVILENELQRLNEGLRLQKEGYAVEPQTYAFEAGAEARRKSAAIVEYRADMKVYPEYQKALQSNQFEGTFQSYKDSLQSAKTLQPSKTLISSTISPIAGTTKQSLVQGQQQTVNRFGQPISIAPEIYEQKNKSPPVLTPQGQFDTKQFLESGGSLLTPLTPITPAGVSVVSQVKTPGGVILGEPGVRGGGYTPLTVAKETFGELIRPVKEIFQRTPIKYGKEENYFENVAEPISTYLFGTSEELYKYKFEKPKRREPLDIILGRNKEVITPKTPGQYFLEQEKAQNVSPEYLGLPSNVVQQRITENINKDLSTAYPISGIVSKEGNQLFKSSSGVTLEYEPSSISPEEITYIPTKESEQLISSIYQQRISFGIGGIQIAEQKLQKGMGEVELTRTLGKETIKLAPLILATGFAPELIAEKSTVSTLFGSELLGSSFKPIAESVLSKDKSLSERGLSLGLGLGMNVAGALLIRKGIALGPKSFLESELKQDLFKSLSETKPELVIGKRRYSEGQDSFYQIQFRKTTEKGATKQTITFNLPSREYNTELFGYTETGQKVLTEKGAEKIASSITKGRFETKITSIISGKTYKTGGKFGGQTITDILGPSGRLRSGLIGFPVEGGTTGISTGFVDIGGKRIPIKSLGIAKESEGRIEVIGGKLKGIKYTQGYGQTEGELISKTDIATFNPPKVKTVSSIIYNRRFGKDSLGIYYPESNEIFLKRDLSSLSLKKSAESIRDVFQHELAHALFQERKLYGLSKTNYKIQKDIYEEIKAGKIIEGLSERGYTVKQKKFAPYTKQTMNIFHETTAFAFTPNRGGGFAGDIERVKEKIPNFYKYFYERVKKPAAIIEEYGPTTKIKLPPTNIKATGEFGYVGIIYKEPIRVERVSGSTEDIGRGINEVSSSGGTKLLQETKQIKVKSESALPVPGITQVVKEQATQRFVSKFIKPTTISQKTYSASVYAGKGLYERTSGGLLPSEQTQLNRQIQKEFQLPKLTVPQLGTQKTKQAIVPSQSQFPNLIYEQRNVPVQFTPSIPALSQPSRQRLDQSTALKSPSVTSPSPGITQPITPKPNIPLPLPYIPGFSESYKYKAPKPTKRPKYRYQASFTAGILGITRPSEPARLKIGGYSGLGIAGIVSPRRKRKKKK